MQKSTKKVIANLLKASAAISLGLSLVACSEDNPTNSGEAAWGKETTLTDTRDGRTYKVVTIGPMVWMAENLNYFTESSHCYDSNLDLCEQYGRLYPREDVIGDTPCPIGWRLPREIEAEALLAYGISSLLASGTNSTGFSALLGGGCHNYDDIIRDGQLMKCGGMEMWAAFWMVGGHELIDLSPDAPWSEGADASIAVVGSDLYASVRCIKETPYVDPSSVKAGVLIDTRDGKTYKTVKIGNQTWMAENLNYFDESLLGKCWCYGNNPDYCEVHGRLYGSNAIEGLCPDGWHIPTRVEWEILREATGDLFRTDGPDDYGFSVQGAGYMKADGSFVGGSAYAGKENYGTIIALSVRCLQD